MKEFKAGDKVYFPALGGNIVELRENESGFTAYALIAERMGRNPKTGEEMLIKASKSVRFKPSKAIKGKLNGEA